LYLAVFFTLVFIGCLNIQSFRNVLMNLPVLSEFFEGNELDRWYMIRNSFWLFLESPLTGVGLDNSKLVAYKNGYEDFFYSQNIMSFRTQYVHNIYAKLLAELGFAGLILFLSIFLYPLYQFLNRSREFTPFQYACAAYLISFLLGGMTSHITVFHRNFFSPMMLIALLALSQILPKSISREIRFIGVKTKMFFIILSAVSLTFFIQNYKAEHDYKELEALKNHPEQYFQKFDKLFKPKLKTFAQGRPFLPRLAEYAVSKDSIERARQYYDTALSFAPYDVNLLFSSANFYFVTLQDNGKAKELALRALSIHKDYLMMKFLLAKVEFENKNYKIALGYLDFLDDLKARLDRGQDRAGRLPENLRNRHLIRLNKQRLILKEGRKLKQMIKRKRSR